MIELKSIEKEYGINGHSQQVLNGITITLDKGNIYALVGPSGSGKSTLLNIIGGLIHPTKGEVKIGDKNITEFNSNQLAELRTNDIGFIFQDFNLIPFLNVKENILFSLRLKGEKIENHSDNYEQLVNWLGIKKIEEKYINEISGGEQQRVAIARAIVNNPKVLIADEPTGNLDPEISWEIMQVLERINLQGTTILMATHNSTIVNNLRHRVIAIEEGRIVRDEEEGEYGYHD